MRVRSLLILRACAICVSAMNDPRTQSVDFSKLEEHKENVQRLASGRSASKLQALFSSDRKTIEQELKEGHARFREEIARVESGSDDEGDDDKLDVYHR